MVDTDRIHRDASNTEEESEIQGSESLESHNVLGTGILFSNNKRTYDAYQQRDLVGLDRNQAEYDADRGQTRRHTEILFGLATQAMQNAIQVANRVANTSTSSDVFSDRTTVRHADNSVETSEMVGKRAMDDHDLAEDYKWSGSDMEQGAAQNELARTVSLDDASLKAIGAAIADALRSK